MTEKKVYNEFMALEQLRDIRKELANIINCIGSVACSSSQVMSEFEAINKKIREIENKIYGIGA